MARGTPPALHFVGIDDLNGRPHIVCDGAPRDGTVLTLSHWPATPCPPRLARDLSTEIALAYLERPRYWRHDASAVTNDHFDEDGLAGLFALCDPNAAHPRHEALVDFARAGDFGIARTKSAARSLFVVQGLADEMGSRAANPTGEVARMYVELLGRLPEILDQPERFAPHYLEQESALRSSREAVRTGRAVLEEHHGEGLCVVSLEHGLSVPSRLNFGHGVELPLHPFAIHEATPSMRVLITTTDEFPRRFIYYDRYETWVRYCSRRLPLRRDLTGLATALSELEPDGARWVADGPGSLVPTLRLVEGEQSALKTSVVLEKLLTHLRRAPVAWDPFRKEGAHVERRRGVS